MHFPPALFFWASPCRATGVVDFLSGLRRENRYIMGGAAGKGHTFCPYRGALPISLAEHLFSYVRLHSLPSGILRGPVECHGAYMQDPPAGGRGRSAPPDVSFVTPPGREGRKGLRRTTSEWGQTGICPRVSPPPPPPSVDSSPGRRGSFLMPTDGRSALNTFRSVMLADVTWALSESSRRADSGGQASEQGGTSRSHKKQHNPRRRRPSTSSSSSDEFSSGSTDGQDARGATTSHGANPAVPPLRVLQCSDDRFWQVLD